MKVFASKIALVLSVVALLISLSSCAQGAPQPSPAPPVPPATPAPTPPPAETPPPPAEEPSAPPASPPPPPPPPPTSSAAEHSLDIKGFAFNPSPLTVQVGDKVTWTNQDSAPHTVTVDSGTEFDSGRMSQGDTFSHTFNKAGTFSYHCGIHPSMKAEIIVQD